ncbi:hypothetical protein BKA69DRAFT_1039087 [Paraphysoderma sedebokerense]|nr:hypothetical protein BKA69DRAFT_1039087 [Paraphysoderma sedebokerense]
MYNLTSSTMNSDILEPDSRKLRQRNNQVAETRNGGNVLDYYYGNGHGYIDGVENTSHQYFTPHQELDSDNDNDSRISTTSSSDISSARLGVQDILQRLDKLDMNSDKSCEDGVYGGGFAGKEEELEKLRNRFGVHLHFVKPTDTVQGLAVLYGVEVPNLLKKNRLWTNDSIHSRKYLIIPNQTSAAAYLSRPPPSTGTLESSSSSSSRFQQEPDMYEINSNNVNGDTTSDLESATVSSKLQSIDNSISDTIQKLEQQGFQNLRTKSTRSQPHSHSPPTSLYLSQPLPSSLSHYDTMSPQSTSNIPISSQPTPNATRIGHPPSESSSSTTHQYHYPPTNVSFAQTPLLRDTDINGLLCSTPIPPNLATPFTQISQFVSDTLDINNPKYRYQSITPVNSKPSNQNLTKVEKLVLDWVLNSSSSPSSGGSRSKSQSRGSNRLQNPRAVRTSNSLNQTPRRPKGVVTEDLLGLDSGSDGTEGNSPSSSTTPRSKSKDLLRRYYQLDGPDKTNEIDDLIQFDDDGDNDTGNNEGEVSWTSAFVTGNGSGWTDTEETEVLDTVEMTVLRKRKVK